ncbi:MAG: xanthine permease [Proteobacteria bacterium]|nr:xanthine permease [Pseudomonadota bacterium]
MKPTTLTYGVDDTPPLLELASLGLQQVLMGAAGWVMMATVLATLSVSLLDTQSMLRMGMIVTGLGAMLQANRRGPVGSGYLCPPISAPAFFSTTILAGGGFGLATLFGMTTVAGAIEVVLARLLPRIRFLFPPEVIGVVMVMVGIAVLPTGFPRLLADPATLSAGADQGRNVAVGIVTLATMTGCTVWGRGLVKLLPLLVGIFTGVAAALALGCVPPTALPSIMNEPWIGWPHRAVSGFAFEWSLLLPFTIACVASSLKNVGDLTMCQKINDSDWKRTDMASVSRGASVLGIVNIASGLLGTVSHNASSSNIGLAVASGAASRSISYSFGALMVLCAFLPKVAATITALPPPITGAAVIYCACFMMLAGIQLLTSRLLDTRRILMAGCALAFGLSAGLMPHLYVNAPHFLKPILNSPVSFSALVALVLRVRRLSRRPQRGHHRGYRVAAPRHGIAGHGPGKRRDYGRYRLRRIPSGPRCVLPGTGDRTGEDAPGSQHLAERPDGTGQTLRLAAGPTCRPGTHQDGCRSLPRAAATDELTPAGHAKHVASMDS